MADQNVVVSREPALPSRALPQHLQPLLRRHFVEALHQSLTRPSHLYTVVLSELLHQAHHCEGDRGFDHHLWGQDGGNLRGGLAGGGVAEDLQALGGVDEGEEVEAADSVPRSGRGDAGGCCRSGL